MRFLVSIVALCGLLLAACQDAPTNTPAAAPPTADASTPAAPAPSRDELRMQRLLQPGADVRPGELTADEAGHVVDLISQLPDDQAFATLHAYGPGISSGVAGLLGSEKPLDRVAGVKLTHGLRLSRHYPRLVELTKDKDARVRRSLTLALAQVGTDEQVAALVPLMDDPEFFIRLASQRALADRKDRGLVDYAKRLVGYEKRVARLRAYQALADVAVPADAKWFRKQLDRDLDVSTEREEVWRGLATADPELALATAENIRASKKNPMGWHEYHNLLLALAPNVPEEAVIAELDAQLPGAGKRVYQDLAQALARTKGEQAAARADELMKKERWACAIILGRLGAEKEWTARAALFERELAKQDSGDKAVLQARLAALRADLAWIKPLADAAMQAQIDRVPTQGLCRNLGGALSERRLDSLIPLLANANPDVRGAAADVLGRFGAWRHLKDIAALYHDKDAKVRERARLAMRLQVGVDLRRKEGFLWHSWFVHTFGALPKQHRPVEDPAAALAEDFKVINKLRPLDSKPKTTQDKGLQPRKMREPSSAPASGKAPGKK